MKKIVLLVIIACAAAFDVGAAQADAGVYARDGARFALEGRLAEAARAFEQAVALDPENGNAFYGLGNVYAEMGRWADAVNAYYKAVSLNREDVEALNNLGVALSMRGQHVQAAAAFERATKIYPKWAEPFYHLGEARRALGQEEEARAAFARAGAPEGARALLRVCAMTGRGSCIRSLARVASGDFCCRGRY